MTWSMLVVLMLPPIAGLLLGLYALRPDGAFMCGSCDVARQAAASAPRPVEPADLHEALARQWDRLGMPDLAATERDIAAKLRGTG